MSDDELSTARQWSDASSEKEDVICRFTNPLTGGTYFTKPLKFDEQMSIGFLVHMVKSELGYSAFQLKVGKQVWQMGDVYGKFWLHQSVLDALGASDDHEIIVQVIRVTMPEDEETMPEEVHR